jgi:transposase
MDRARIHEGIRRMRFTDILGRSERSELSQMEAAELLGVSKRTFRRWRDRHRDAGPAGLDDRRLAPSLRRAPVAEIERMLGLYRDLYRGFTVKHFHEQLGKRHNYTLGYTVTKVHLHRAGLVQAATKRSAHRKKRPRRPWWAGCCTRMPRRTPGCRVTPASMTSLSLWKMQRARSTRCFWSMKRAPRRVCGAGRRWWRGTACSARSTPTGAA